MWLTTASAITLTPAAWQVFTIARNDDSEPSRPAIRYDTGWYDVHHCGPWMCSCGGDTSTTPYPLGPREDVQAPATESKRAWKRADVTSRGPGGAASAGRVVDRSRPVQVATARTAVVASRAVAARLV